jgi:hypothetical protein
MMFIQTWGGVFTGSLINLWDGFMGFVPNLLGAIILFIVGWLVGSLIGKAVMQVLTSLKVDKLFESAGANDLMNRTGMKLSVSVFLAGVVKWFIIVAFLMTSLQIVGLTQVNDFLSNGVLVYLSRVVIATLVLIIATVISDTMKKLVEGSAKAANIRSSGMLGSITSHAIWIFAFIIALSELGIATEFMQILFTGFVAALAIGLGLAFGLGGKDAAGRAVEKFSESMRSR